MRIAVIFLFILFMANANGQVRLVSNASIDPHPKQITFRCDGRTITGPAPLLIVDGRVMDINKINEFTPSTISKVEVLKGAKAAMLYGSQGANGVILVTTKSLLKLRIFDAEDAAVLKNATVRFIDAARKDTFMLMADSNGRAVSGNLRSKVGYELQVTAVGYEDLQTRYFSANGMDSLTVSLNRKYVTGEEIFVTTAITQSAGCGFRMRYSATAEEKRTHKEMKCYTGLPAIRLVQFVTVDHPVHVSELRLYPVPLSAGQMLHVELNAAEKGTGSVRLLSASGVSIQNKQVEIIEGMNRYELNPGLAIASGVYFLVVIDAHQHLLAKQQIVIQ